MCRRTLIARRIVEELAAEGHQPNEQSPFIRLLGVNRVSRFQQLLVESLKRYEDRMELRTPDRKEWTFLNSFNYAYGLLLTLGHGAKIPETLGGQIFALVYCILGVPLFFGTLAITVYYCIMPIIRVLAISKKSCRNAIKFRD
ncbi:hypothetical protein OESDEN_03247 [Oesophagostomum dentatum]|uniref:Potassium channel domain-containing protein n=1 Tax=Oesophagostomum dentatum TaxID=61180 RepID=A0A0B1TL18_OESDE|nr:hypothetical protein OESDEN_03247 [Oesophagostomum dentatum]